MMTVEELNALPPDELEAVIRDDTEGQGEMLFALEGELMDIMREAVFPDSETFGDLDEETKPERYLRELIESMGFPETLSAINALYALEKAEDNEGDDE